MAHVAVARGGAGFDDQLLLCFWPQQAQVRDRCLAMIWRVLHAIGLLACLWAALLHFPSHQLSPRLAADYHELFGERNYRVAQASQDVAIKPFVVEEHCRPEYESWRQAHTIEGIDISATEDCIPDNPWEVAAAVKGTNNVDMGTLMKGLLAPDAVDKSEDRDGDGDPDLIHIRLEIMELNGRSTDVPETLPYFEIAPGIAPGLWVFAPKSRGMSTVNFESIEANRLIRLPAPAIRVEQDDEVMVTVENTHYLPHTIHFHGVDHPFETPAGEGNDGVPMFSEHPVPPGGAKTYWLSPRQAGTAFYHCHVQPHSHILMGLQGLFIVEENRPNNWVQTLNVGGGRVRARSIGVSERYDREFDLHYFEIDKELNDRIKAATDPRLISKSIHREYNITQRVAEYYVLNGRSFPYTLRESLVVLKPEERVKLRVLNGGGEGLALHFHGHKPALTHSDGVILKDEQRRDVFWMASAQRADFALSSENDGLKSYGAGAWMLHDHRERAVTTNGIGPGGGVSMLVYDDYLEASGLPKTVHGEQSLGAFFDPAYYRGDVPVFAMMPHGLGEAPVTSPSSHRSFRFALFSFFALLWLMAGWVLFWQRD
ncbi:MAG: multicopper oxidase domain-containing protein [Pseudomonadota bacterium]